MRCSFFLLVGSRAVVICCILLCPAASLPWPEITAGSHFNSMVQVQGLMGCQSPRWKRLSACTSPVILQKTPTPSSAS